MWSPDSQIVRIASVSAACPDATASAPGIPTAVVLQSDHPDRAARDAALADMVEEERPDLVVLAGWMSILTGTFLDRFPDRVINLHPSMLPAFPGMHAIEEALAWGVRWTGVTVHFVEEQVDGGPPILQEPVEVLYGDSAESLTARIREVEHRLVPRVVRLMAAGRVQRDPVHRRLVSISEGRSQ